jgi:hypothetical protein
MLEYIVGCVLLFGTAAGISIKIYNDQVVDKIRGEDRPPYIRLV